MHAVTTTAANLKLWAVVVAAQSRSSHVHRYVDGDACSFLTVQGCMHIHRCRMHIKNIYMPDWAKINHCQRTL